MAAFIEPASRPSLSVVIPGERNETRDPPVAPLPPAEQPLDVGELQLDIGRAAVVALPGMRGRLHLAEQGVHLVGAEPAAVVSLFLELDPSGKGHVTVDDLREGWASFVALVEEWHATQRRLAANVGQEDAPLEAAPWRVEDAVAPPPAAADAPTVEDSEEPVEAAPVPAVEWPQAAGAPVPEGPSPRRGAEASAIAEAADRGDERGLDAGRDEVASVECLVGEAEGNPSGAVHLQIALAEAELSEVAAEATVVAEAAVADVVAAEAPGLDQWTAGVADEDVAEIVIEDEVGGGGDAAEEREEAVADGGASAVAETEAEVVATEVPGLEGCDAEEEAAAVVVEEETVAADWEADRSLEGGEAKDEDTKVTPRTVVSAISDLGHGQIG